MWYQRHTLGLGGNKISSSYRTLSAYHFKSLYYFCVPFSVCEQHELHVPVCNGC